jgi:hypothetical protein
MQPKPNGSQTDLLAIERHGSRVWCLIVLPALIVPAVSVLFRPTAPAMFSLVLVGAVGIGVLALIWSGFEYRFLRHAVVVKTLGFTLRTIPKQQIVSYGIESWSWPRGYGIRGVGSRRAYVWGNHVVHIRTTNGEIFLGHDDPERIVRDLDQVTGFAGQRTSAPAAGEGKDERR